MYADFDRLAETYDFVSVGRTRIADQLCEVIRIVPRDGTRYGYIVWLDSETKLPLRVDLLDRDGETLEQYRVVSFAVDDGVRNIMQGWKAPSFLRLSSYVKCRTLTGSRLCQQDEGGAKNAVSFPHLTSGETSLFTDGLVAFH